VRKNPGGTFQNKNDAVERGNRTTSEANLNSLKALNQTEEGRPTKNYNFFILDNKNLQLL
jgi:hypothetical protein